MGYDMEICACMCMCVLCRLPTTLQLFSVSLAYVLETHISTTVSAYLYLYLIYLDCASKFTCRNNSIEIDETYRKHF